MKKVMQEQSYDILNYDIRFGNYFCDSIYTKRCSVRRDLYLVYSELVVSRLGESKKNWPVSSVLGCKEWNGKSWRFYFPCAIRYACYFSRIYWTSFECVFTTNHWLALVLMVSLSWAGSKSRIDSGWSQELGCADAWRMPKGVATARRCRECMAWCAGASCSDP